MTIACFHCLTNSEKTCQKIQILGASKTPPYSASADWGFTAFINSFFPSFVQKKTRREFDCRVKTGSTVLCACNDRRLTPIAPIPSSNFKFVARPLLLIFRLLVRSKRSSFGVVGGTAGSAGGRSFLKALS
jgi:hypothetical protein